MHEQVSAVFCAQFDRVHVRREINKMGYFIVNIWLAGKIVFLCLFDLPDISLNNKWER